MRKNRFIYQNPNPAKHECEDDVIRAISLALNTDWDQVYSDLCVLGASLHRMPNDKECYKAYLIRNGFHRTGISHRKGDGSSYSNCGFTRNYRFRLCKCHRG